MKAMRVLTVLLAVGLAGTLVLAGGEAPRTRPTQPAPGRAVFGGPFYALKGLSAEVRQQLAALWDASKEKAATAKTDAAKALKAFDEKGEALLNDAQKVELKALRLAREERARLLRERPPAPAATRAAPRPTIRAFGPLTDLKDVTDDQVKKINDLMAARDSSRKAATEAMQTAMAAADKTYAEGLDQVLTDEQKAALKAIAEKAKADREAAAAKARTEREAADKKAAEERKKREFGGDFTLLKNLSDEQKLGLGALWAETVAARAAAAKTAKDADQEYLEKGKRLLTAEQLQALEDSTKPKPPASRPAAKP